MIVRLVAPARGRAWWRAALSVLLALTLPGSLLAEEPSGPIIDVVKAPDRRIAVGIGKFETVPANEVGSPASDVVAFDLDLTGWFQPVLPGMLPPVTLEDWARRGAEVVIDLKADRGTLDGAVRDAGTGEVLFQGTYPAGDGGTLRARMHRFADDVSKKLTGQPGLARTRLLCEWDSGSGKRIVLMDADGWGMKPLTGEDALELSPRWSADGRKVIFTSFASGYPDVYIQDLVTGARQKIAHYEGLNVQGDLSPDGKTVALTLSLAGDPEIYTKDLAAGTIRRLTRNPATDTTPVWSPDGHRIAFVSDRSGGPQVYVMNADGSSVRRVTVRGSYNTAPEWSPDGTKLAYCALRPDGFQIQVVELDGGNVTTITDVSGCEDPCWSPDGRSILYSRKAGGRTDLYVTNLSERRALRVSRGSGRFTAPDWSPIP
ncbi:MAG: DPP IV N-terminal domain-containing protein [bacterium]